MKYIICFLTLLFTIQIGISQNWSHIYGDIKVLDIAEMPNDVWVATDKGLFQINKTTLQSTHYNKNNSLLLQDHVQTLVVDQMGSLWIGTYDLILLRVNPNGVWTGFNYPNSIQGVSMVGNLVYCSAVDANGTVWLGSSKGLMSFDGNNWELANYQNYPVWDMAINSTGKIQVGSVNFLTYDINSEVWTEYPHPNNISGGILAYNDARIAQQNDTTCFFFPDHGGSLGAVHRIQNGNWTSWNDAFGTGGNPINLPLNFNGNHLSIAKYGNHIYYNANNSNLLGYFNGNQWLIDSTIAQLNTGLDKIDYCFISSNGDYWLFDEAKIVKYNNTVAIGELMPIAGFNYATKLVTDNQSEVYMTNYYGGIKKLQQGSWTVVPGSDMYVNYGITHFDGNNNAWYVSRNSNYELAIVEQNNNAPNGWILHDNTTTVGGLFPTTNGSYIYDMGVSSNSIVLVRDNLDKIYKYQNNIWTIIASPANPASILASEMSADHLGNLWWMERLETSPNFYTYSLKKFDGVNIQSISTGGIGFQKPYLDANGHLWTAFTTGEIRKFDGTTWTIYNFTPSNARAVSITGRNNTLYIATQDHGLLEFDGTNWVSFNTTNSPLTANELRQLALGNDGNLWIANDGGNIIDIYQTGLITSIEKTATINALELQIFPNPATETIFIKTTIPVVENIRIVNLLGHIVYQSNTNQNSINVSELPTGVYWVLVNENAAQLIIEN